MPSDLRFVPLCLLCLYFSLKNKNKKKEKYIEKREIIGTKRHERHTGA